MRIAQVSPLWERVPPPGYGGIELVVGHLTDELVRRGHDVTLFATGDSQTLAQLESVTPHALRLSPTIKEPEVYDLLQLKRVLEQADRFDLIHFHNGLSALPWAALSKTPTVHTIHCGFSEDNCQLYAQYATQNYISISNAQQQLPPQLNYVRTAYNGIPGEDYSFCEKPQDPPYLAFLGRIAPEKGTHHAIAIAQRTGLSLKMAGKVDKINQDFFEREVAPHIDGEQIQYLGEANHQQKVELLSHAVATLFPITWHEPFGLVMIESMSTGTPVIAMSLGSVPEVIAHRKTGFVCNSLEEMVAAVPQARQLNRQHCHNYVQRYFSVTAMVDKYEAAYQKVINQKFERNGRLHTPALTLEVA